MAKRAEQAKTRRLEKRTKICTLSTGRYKKHMKLTNAIKDDTAAIKADTAAMKADTAAIKAGTAAIKADVEKVPEKTAGEVVKAMAQPMKDEAGNIMDCTKEQADRLERNIPMVITEQVAAQLAAYFGPVPHPGSSASSSASAIDKKLKQATKLRKAAEK